METIINVPPISHPLCWQLYEPVVYAPVGHMGEEGEDIESEMDSDGGEKQGTNDLYVWEGPYCRGRGHTTGGGAILAVLQGEGPYWPYCRGRGHTGRTAGGGVMLQGEWPYYRGRGHTGRTAGGGVILQGEGPYWPYCRGRGHTTGGVAILAVLQGEGPYWPYCRGRGHATGGVAILQGEGSYWPYCRGRGHTGHTTLGWSHAGEGTILIITALAAVCWQ